MFMEWAGLGIYILHCLQSTGYRILWFNSKETTGKTEAEIAAMFRYKGDVTGEQGEQGRAENVEAAKPHPHIVLRPENDDAGSVNSAQTKESDKVRTVPRVDSKTNTIRS
jgi:hypothetical protein